MVEPGPPVSSSAPSPKGVRPVAETEPRGQSMGPEEGPSRHRPGLLSPWEQGLGCAEAKPARPALSPREASLCPPGQGSAGPRRPGPCAPRGRPSPAPRGAVLVQREKDLAAYNWNSFGLRYGKRLAAPGSRRGSP
ncbi:metastasis-suppressor KiSS-1 [Dipodomys spectabilis]|uniref:metastasis-suppressor KiSS-1 n=1 Tax=Dipodomys spectabilis TaxID=105255 RepID=UPI001C536E7B|nr:metastasis-suppressor KiSS-1 [Dipodomys spectabilis]